MIVFVLTLCAIVSGFAWYYWNSMQPKLPIYPNVKEVSIRDKNEISDGIGKIKTTVYTISFWTPDTSNAVLAFYRDKLRTQGWVIESTNSEGTLIYHRQQETGAPREGLTVSAGPSQRPNFTHVVLTMGDYEAMQRVHALGD